MTTVERFRADMGKRKQQDPVSYKDDSLLIEITNAMEGLSLEAPRDVLRYAMKVCNLGSPLGNRDLNDVARDPAARKRLCLVSGGRRPNKKMSLQEIGKDG